MSTRNVKLTDHFNTFINTSINSGRFSNASEVVRKVFGFSNSVRRKITPN